MISGNEPHSHHGARIEFAANRNVADWNRHFPSSDFDFALEPHRQLACQSLLGATGWTILRVPPLTPVGQAGS